MSDVSTPASHVAPDVSPVAARWNMVKEALGVTRNEDVAAITGVPLRTLDRLFERPRRSLLHNAMQVSEATGISVDELLAGRRAAALSEAA